VTQPTADGPVRIAYAALGSGSAPVWVAHEAGYFREEGLEVELALIRGSEAVVEQLLAGGVQFGNIAAPAVLGANLAGADLVYLTGGLNRLIQSIVTVADIREPGQLRGRTLGLRLRGDFDDYAGHFVLGQHGLRVGPDVRAVRIDSQPDAIEKMDAGLIDGSVFSPPYVFTAVKHGHRVLIDAGPTSPEYQLGGLVARRALVAARPDVVRGVVRAYVRGVHRLGSDPAFAVDVLKRYSQITEDDVARSTLDVLATYLRPAPYPSVPGIAAVLEHLAGQYPEARTADPSAMVDLRWVDELERSGFVASLYASAAP
jgi:ABC-type nitrate/sulfonate/bicarbonate transport system substrate-binding protein